MADLFTGIQRLIDEIAAPLRTAHSAVPPPPGALAAALGAMISLADEVVALDSATASFASLPPLLEATGRALAAIESVAREAGNAQPLLLDAETLAAQLVSLLLTRAAVARAPGALEAAWLLGLATSSSPLGPKTLDLAGLPALATDPRAALLSTFGLDKQALSTEHGATIASTVLFQRIARLLDLTGVDATYTGSDGPAGIVPATLAHAGRALVVPFGPGSDVGLAAVLDTDTQGDPVLAVSAIGTGTVQFAGDHWTVTAVLEMSDGPVLIGLNGVSDAAAADVSVRVTVTAKLAAGGVFATSRQGTRVELSGLAVALTASADVRGWDFGISLALDSLRVAVAGDGGDNLVNQALAGGQTSPPSKLELGWSRHRGLYLGAGTGLSVRIPLPSLGGIGTGAITVAIGPSPAAVVLSATLELGLNIGPVHLGIDRIGPAIAFSAPAGTGNLGLLHLDPALLGPTLVAVSVQAPDIAAGGFLATTADGYIGAVAVQIGPVAVTGVGLLTVRGPDGRPLTAPDGSEIYSLMVVLSATFPPIQLGLGFALSGLGGVLGLHRGVNVDALRSGVRSGAVDVLLFPRNPAAAPGPIVAALTTDFPLAPGRFVGGPMVRISWGEPVIVTAAVAVLVELPDPVVILLLGRIQMELPDHDSAAMVVINLDALGVVDLAQGQLSLTATIHDSRIGAFTLSGDMAMQLGWKGDRRFLFSIGGWHPAYTPPPNFPALRRVALVLSGSANAQLSVAAYLAVTSNTVQFGGTANVRLSGGGAVAAGSLSLDTLINLHPFGLRVDVAAGVSVSFDGVNLLAVALTGTITGPNPWHITGQASFNVLFYTAHVTFDATFGSSSAVAAAPGPVRVVDLVAAEVAKQANWLAVPTAADGLIQVSDAPPGMLRVHPLAVLSFHQRIAPLAVAMTRFGPAAIDGPSVVRVVQASAGGRPVGTTPDVTDEFAPANFLDLTAAQKLSSPSFVVEQAGVSLTAPPIDFDARGAADATFRTAAIEFVDPGGEPPAAGAVTPAGRAVRAHIVRPAPPVRIVPDRSRWPRGAVR